MTDVNFEGNLNYVQAKLADHILRIGLKGCSVCGSKRLVLCKHVVQVPRLDATATFPALMITCDDCANMVFWDAERAGLKRSELENL